LSSEHGVEKCATQTQEFGGNFLALEEQQCRRQKSSQKLVSKKLSDMEYVVETLDERCKMRSPITTKRKEKINKKG
jgi:hypothetical protein